MHYFLKTFLVTNIYIEKIPKMLFLTIKKVEINFTKQELNLKTYILDKALSTIKRM